MCPLPALCSLITIYPARQGFTGLLNEGIHKINNTHKVIQKHFHVMSIGGRLQGSYNTIFCPQCQRRPIQTGIIYIGHCSCVSTVCVRDIITRDQIFRPSPSIFTYCKEWKGEWPGNGMEMRLGQTLQELNVQYTFRVVFLAVGTDLQ